MEQNANPLTPEAATDQRASSLNLPSRPDRPPDASPRGASDDASLISGQLSRYVPVATDALGRRRRCDGLTPERQCVFLDVLSRSGVAADAARAAGVSRDTAYALRNSARGAAFALGWDAAILISRGRMSDELESRALNGVVDRIYRNGELWGERHRHDNRLAMAVLTRLDRQAEGLGEGAATARVVAQEWDQFLDIVRDGGEGAGEFLAARASVMRLAAEDATAPAAAGAALRIAEDLQASVESAERLFSYCMFGGGLSDETDISDLEPAQMATWTELGWERAQRSGLLRSLRREDWPRSARESGPPGADGICRNRQDIERSGAGNDSGKPETDYWNRVPGLARARREYRRRFPDAAPGAAPVEQTPESDHTPSDTSSGGEAE